MFYTIPSYWKDYELIDSGNYKKLERFNNVIIIRPESQALWEPSLSEKEWYTLAQLEYVPETSNSGKWRQLKHAIDTWNIEYPVNGSDKNKIKINLKISSFKNIGIFPEQAYNWDFLWKIIKNYNKKLNILNLFAYTGISSIVCAKAGASVTHVDSLKSAVMQACYNAKLNNINSIRWIIDDAIKFVKREIKRNNKYNGVILDPPTFGHGPKGEIWKLEQHLYLLMKYIYNIIEKENYFLLLNVYSPGISVVVLENIINSIYKPNYFISGELYISDKFNKKISAGIFIQVINIK
ncbi:MAG: class I SAM-dependent methyltransferase [Bacteroidales bacterium]|nr:class I SAM-dependent methyltransferase [Bacteroidales bacterium]